MPSNINNLWGKLLFNIKYPNISKENDKIDIIYKEYLNKTSTNEQKTNILYNSYTKNDLLDEFKILSFENQLNRIHMDIMKTKINLVKKHITENNRSNDLEKELNNLISNHKRSIISKRNLFNIN